MGPFQLPASVVLSAVTLCLVTSLAHAGESDQLLPTGVVFPQFPTAIRIDAAALPYGQGSELQFGYSPAAGGTSQNVIEVDYEHSGSSWGAGIGFQGTDNNGGNSSTLLLGGGARFSDVSVGLSMARPLSSSVLIPGLDASLQIGSGNGLQFAAVFYGLPTSINSMTLALGHRQAGHYSLEGGARMPFLTNLFSPGSLVTPYLGGAIFGSGVGASFMMSVSSSGISAESMGLVAILSSKTKLSFLWTNRPILGNGESPLALAPGVFTLGAVLAL